MRQKRYSAFTLVEILVVLAIMSILASMLLPSLSRAREGGRRAACQSNLRQIGMATSMYIEDYDERYPLMVNTVKVKRPPNNIPGCQDDAIYMVSWAYPLLPYAKNDGIFQCPSLAEYKEEPQSSVPAIELWNNCVPIGSPGGGDGGGGGTPSCPPPENLTWPEPAYGFNTMIKHETAWMHTTDAQVGQGFADPEVIINNCSNPPGATRGVLVHIKSVHAVAVTLPSETIMIADAQSEDNKGPSIPNFVMDLELDFASSEPIGPEELTARTYLSRRHLHGYNALFADGHVKFMPFSASHPQQWTIEAD